MNVTTIPFVRLTGIEQTKQGLALGFSTKVQNHIQTIHAGAQFTLAETQSGLYLQELFPELEGKVIPLLRDARIKYKKPALEKIFAYANTSSSDIEKFKEQLSQKGRGVIEIEVLVKDENEVLTCSATFSWFVQML